MPVLSMKVKQGEIIICLILKMNLSTTVSMKKSRRELSMGYMTNVYPDGHLKNVKN